ncbi:MAG: DASH family cryptochrome [Lewinellaceae bacterium]|nr:DASH family cryptochrome [Phaeodactylibacter sp.]MCB0612368.1 DASH family cryptochrome [Phaeodactylibacter sp.]MCB9349516.1 DASH family cryptochrome [Lewinellaceae bacterium]
MYTKRAILWFRLDLRLHDNEALQEALNSADEVIPVYVFDERIFWGRTHYFGFPKTAKFRAQFIIESVRELRQSLRELGSDLIVRVGKPEEEVFEIAKKARAHWVFCNRERTDEEVKVQDALEKNLWSIGQEMRYSRGKLLYYTADLPFPIQHTPDTFTQFRKEVERYVPVRSPLPTPEALPPITVALEPGVVPGLQNLGHEVFEPDPRATLSFRGGEREGLRRLHYYLWEGELIDDFKESRDGLIGGDYSTKLSPWLAQGCLSPKMAYYELRKYEEKYGKSKFAYELFYYLMLRDYYRFMAKKYCNQIFFKSGPQNIAGANWRNDRGLLQQWTEGRTGVPFIDANMREISQTGYMSSRGRQNVASFLINDLGVNWQMGAEYFESVLIDYDVASNWGNWNFIAGVGSGARDARYLNIISQAKTYDPKGEYVKLWLPELKGLPPEKIHQPDQLSFSEQEELHLRIGDDYPRAMVSTDKWRG